MSALIDYVRDHIETIGGTVLIGAGFIGLGGHLMARRGARASLTWPSVVGHVIESRPSLLGRSVDGIDNDRPPMHSLVVKYRYQVNGRSYANDVYGHGDDPEGTIDEVSADARRRFPAGRDVQVFYDPRDPANAVLERGRSNGTLVGAAIFVGIALFGAWTLWQGLSTAT